MFCLQFGTLKAPFLIPNVLADVSASKSPAKCDLHTSVSWCMSIKASPRHLCCSAQGWKGPSLCTLQRARAVPSLSRNCRSCGNRYRATKSEPPCAHLWSWEKTWRENRTNTFVWQRACASVMAGLPQRRLPGTAGRAAPSTAQAPCSTSAYGTLLPAPLYHRGVN